MLKPVMRYLTTDLTVEKQVAWIGILSLPTVSIPVFASIVAIDAALTVGSIGVSAISLAVQAAQERKNTPAHILSSKEKVLRDRLHLIDGLSLDEDEKQALRNKLRDEHFRDIERMI